MLNRHDLDDMRPAKPDEKMTKEEAEAIMRDCYEYVSTAGNGQTIVDGTFSVQELRAIATLAELEQH